MGWLNNWWNKNNSPELPAKVETYNVGKVSVKATYLDTRGQVTYSMGYLFGCCEWEKNPQLGYKPKVVQTSGKRAFYDWLQYAVDFGVYALEDKYIPRERMLEIFTVEEDYEVDVHYEPRPTNS